MTGEIPCMSTPWAEAGRGRESANGAAARSVRASLLGEGGQHGDDPLGAAGHFDAHAFSRSSDDGAHVVDLDGAGLALRLGSALPVHVCAAVLLLDPGAG